MDFQKLAQLFICFLLGVELLFDTFVQVGWKSGHTWMSNYKMVINWAFLSLYLFIYAWISKKNLAQLFIWNICSGRLKVKVTIEGQKI